MLIIKRDGSEKLFEISKIINAISSANLEVDEREQMSKEEIEKCAEDVQLLIEHTGYTVTIEDIQDMVQKELMYMRKYSIATRYIQYRYERMLRREDRATDDSILSLVEGRNEEIKQENSNKNPILASTQRDYMAGTVSKDLTERRLLPSDVVKAWKSGLIHFHDSDYFLSPIHNCDLVNLDDVLQNGTVIGQTLIEKPHSFSTACNITLQVTTAVASSQYGGQSWSLTPLAKFVDVSRKQIVKQLEQELTNAHVAISDDSFDSIVKDRLHLEIQRGVQTIQYQTITMSSTNGQAPFLSIFMYLNEANGDDILKHDLALVIEEMLKQRYQGVKNEVGVWVTPAFPKLLYVLEDDNIHENDEYYYLTELAAKCTAKRMVPDYISEKKMKELKLSKGETEGHGDVYPCMGCADGKSKIQYKLNGDNFYETFAEMWNRMSHKFVVSPQPNYSDLYIDLTNVQIYDMKLGYVDCYRIIRNMSDKWRDITIGDNWHLLCTHDHPFSTENRGIVYAQDLKEGKDIISVMTDDGNVVEREVTTVNVVSYTDYSYDVTTASEHFTVNNIYSHNCRSFLTPDRSGNGYNNIANAGNYNPEEPKYYGRFNQGVVTLNLPYVALESNGDYDKFWKLMDDALDVCHKALRARHERLLGTPSDVAPILWQYGALARLKKGEVIDKLLYDGYSTISLGYAGLYECVKFMTGHSHTDEEATPFAIQVMQKLNDACNKWKAQENIDYSVYGTPLESTTYEFAKALRSKFGKVEGITDHGYITNSYHVNVREKIDAFTKLSFESTFQKLSPGGAISYIEVPNMQDNLQAVMAVLKFIYDTIIYAELNTKSDYCQECGYDGEIEIVEDENGKLIWRCPKCGNTDQNKMSVARRTCGYIGTQFWNQGRTQEIKDRVMHL